MLFKDKNDQVMRSYGGHKPKRFERNKDPWVHKFIENESTYKKSKRRVDHSDDYESSDTEVDEDYNFFQDSVYHDHRAQLDYKESVKKRKREKQILAMKQVAIANNTLVA